MGHETPHLKALSLQVAEDGQCKPLAQAKRAWQMHNIIGGEPQEPHPSGS